VYYCTGGCQDGDLGKVVSVISGYYTPVGSSNWTGGVSVPGHYTWISNHW
jgi:hypothetical protein